MANKYTNIRGQKCPEMINRKFGRLLVLSYIIEKSFMHDYYLCHCDCGKEKIAKGVRLRNGSIKSCGCLRRERAQKWCQTRDQSGEKNASYSCSNTFEKRVFRKAVRARDKVCQMCGKLKEESGRKLSAHHLDGDDWNNSLENGVLLCNSCHLIVTRNGNVWRPCNG